MLDIVDIGDELYYEFWDLNYIEYGTINYQSSSLCHVFFGVTARLACLGICLTFLVGLGLWSDFGSWLGIVFGVRVGFRISLQLALGLDIGHA